jgi:uncharacterized glyoxalase superfamily protein PhnB
MITRINVEPIPKEFHTLTPNLVVPDVSRAIDFYRSALGAQERERTLSPDGRTAVHAELKIGDSILMLSPESDMMGTHSPDSLHGSPVSMHLYVPDADEAYKKAVDAGATGKHAPEDAFWGDRFGSVLDPFGYEWGFLTHQEDVTPEERTKRAHAWLAEHSRHIVQD